MHDVFCAIICSMKTNISITIDSLLLKKVEKNFPDKKRSQLIEEALIFWIEQRKKNQVKSDALKLKHVIGTESADSVIELETLEDGLLEI